MQGRKCMLYLKMSIFKRSDGNVIFDWVNLKIKPEETGSESHSYQSAKASVEKAINNETIHYSRRKTWLRFDQLKVSREELMLTLMRCFTSGILKTLKFKVCLSVFLGGTSGLISPGNEGTPLKDLQFPAYPARAAGSRGPGVPGSPGSKVQRSLINCFAKS